MIEKRNARILQRVCVMMTLAIVMLDLPRWCVAVAMVPAAVLLADCALVWMQGGRKE